MWNSFVSSCDGSSLAAKCLLVSRVQIDVSPIGGPIHFQLQNENTLGVILR